MRNLFRFGCLKPKTSDGDDSLLRYPGSKADNGDRYGVGGTTGVTKWQTPPLGKGAKQQLPGYQVCTSNLAQHAVSNNIVVLQHSLMLVVQI